MRFIVRVDDVGQDLDQSRPDVRLQSFRKWLDAWGTLDEPIYLGVVPTFCDQWSLGYLQELEANSKAVVALHGFDHAKQILSPEHIELASSYFPRSRHVVPPYNMYDELTLGAVWCLAQDRKPGVLFGGFDREHHNYGERPYWPSARVVHLDAPCPLYARSYQIVPWLDVFDDDYPRVITLHWRWDWPHLNGVTNLRRALEGRIASTDEIVL